MEQVRKHEAKQQASLSRVAGRGWTDLRIERPSGHMQYLLRHDAVHLPLLRYRQGRSGKAFRITKFKLGRFTHPPLGAGRRNAARRRTEAVQALQWQIGLGLIRGRRGS